MAEVTTRDVYVAIADPTRREILDILFEHEVVAAGTMAARFKAVSRPAISRHLRILKECGVVTTFRRGKTHNFALNPEPLNHARTEWLQKFADKNVKSLVKLREIVEGDTKKG